MGILDFFKSSDGITKGNSHHYGSTAIESFFGGNVKITEEEAMEIPAFAAAVNMICGSIAQLPFTLVKKDILTGEVERKDDDRRLYILNKEPNGTLDSYTFKQIMVKDYLLYGASNIYLEKTLNDVKALYPLQADQLSVQVYLVDGYKKFAKTTINNGGGSRTFEDYQLITIVKETKDGLIGRGILEQHGDILNLARNETKYTSNILKNGALPTGVLKTPKKLSVPAFENLKKSWSNMYEGADKAGKTVILEEGLDYQAISMKPNDMQLTEGRKSTLSEIARIFSIPESMINSNAAKYGSNEQNNLNFLQYCVSPILSAIEAAVNREMLLESEKKDGYSFKIDASQLLQTTRKERAEAIGAEYKEGLISFWEARSDIDRPKTIEDDFFRFSLGSVLYKYANDEMVIPNTMSSKATLEAQQKEKEAGG